MLGQQKEIDTLLLLASGRRTVEPDPAKVIAAAKVLQRWYRRHHGKASFVQKMDAKALRAEYPHLLDRSAVVAGALGSKYYTPVAILAREAVRHHPVVKEALTWAWHRVCGLGHVGAEAQRGDVQAGGGRRDRKSRELQLKHRQLTHEAYRVMTRKLYLFSFLDDDPAAAAKGLNAKEVDECAPRRRTARHFAAMPPRRRAH